MILVIVGVVVLRIVELSSRAWLPYIIIVITSYIEIKLLDPLFIGEIFLGRAKGR